MAIDNGWLTLRETARLMSIPATELMDGVFESWTPVYEFTKTNQIRFRTTDVRYWMLADGWNHRAARTRLIYGH